MRATVDVNIWIGLLMRGDVDEALRVTHFEWAGSRGLQFAEAASA